METASRHKAIVYYTRKVAQGEFRRDGPTDKGEPLYKARPMIWMVLYMELENPPQLATAKAPGLAREYLPQDREFLAVIQDQI